MEGGGAASNLFRQVRSCRESAGAGGHDRVDYIDRQERLEAPSSSQIRTAAQKRSPAARLDKNWQRMNSSELRSTPRPKSRTAFNPTLSHFTSLNLEKVL